MLSLALEKAREAGASKITRLNLALGELSGVVGECVRQYFEVLSQDTIARDAVFSYETKPVVLRCRRCGKDFTPADHRWTCPGCGELSIEIVSGRECNLESIEVE
jgi:hydrogenase nickel incorporation protein HypA/HybF